MIDYRIASDVPGRRTPEASFDTFAGFIASPCLKSSLCRRVVHRPDMAVQFITIITTGTI